MKFQFILWCSLTLPSYRVLSYSPVMSYPPPSSSLLSYLILSSPYLYHPTFFSPLMSCPLLLYLILPSPILFSPSSPYTLLFLPSMLSFRMMLGRRLPLGGGVVLPPWGLWGGEESGEESGEVCGKVMRRCVGTCVERWCVRNSAGQSFQRCQ